LVAKRTFCGFSLPLFTAPPPILPENISPDYELGRKSHNRTDEK
jgi:hypothetical protein